MKAALRRNDDEAGQTAHEHAIMAAIGRIISSTLEIDEVYGRFAVEVAKLFPFERMSINIVNNANNTLTTAFVTGTDVPHRPQGGVFPLTGTVTEEILRIRKCLLIQGEGLWRKYCERFSGIAWNYQAGFRSMMTVPLISKDNVIAVVHFLSHKPEAYAERDLMLAERVGNQIAGAIANAQLFITLKKATEALRENEERFRSLTELSSDWYWEQDEDLRFTSFSGKNFSETSDAASLIGKTLWEAPGMVYDREARAAVQEKMEARQSFHDFEYAYREKDGESSYILASGTPVFDASGRFTGYRGVARDITKQRRDERLLTLEHAVNRCLADALSDAEGIKASIRAICETEGWESGRYFRVDEKAGTMRCIEAWGIDDTVVADYVHASLGRDLPLERGLKGKVWRTGEPQWGANEGKNTHLSGKHLGTARDSFAFALIAEGKTIGVISCTSRQIRQPDSRLLQAVRVIGRQIGQFLQRKEAEKALRENGERFRSLTELSSDWYWEQNEELCFTRFSGTNINKTTTGENLIGKKPWQAPGMFVDPISQAAVQSAMEAGAAFYDLEYSYMEPDGHCRYITTSGTPIYDEAGRFTGYRGVAKDITKRRQDEQVLALEHAINRCLTGTDNTSVVLKTVMRSICENQNWECGRYFHLDKKAGLLRFKEYWYDPNENLAEFIAQSQQVTYALGVGLAGKAWEFEQPLWIEDIKKGGNMIPHGLALGTGLHGTFVFPVTAEGRTIGVLAFLCRMIRQTDERLMQAARAIGSQLGQFLQRKEAEEALRESEETAKKLAQENMIMANIGRIIGSSLNIDEVYNRFAEETRRLIPFDRIAVNIINYDNGTHSSTYVTGTENAVRRHGDVYPLANSTTELIMMKRSGIIIQANNEREMADNYPDFANVLRAGMQSKMSVPLISKDRVIGALHFRSKKANAFTEQNLIHAENIAAHIAGAMANAQLFLEQKRTEEALQQSGEKLRIAYEELKVAQSNLLQREKMASIGQLAAGVAHEINNPTGFIKSNIGSLQKYTARLKEFLNIQSEAIKMLPRENQDALEAKAKALKIDYLYEDIDSLISESMEGVNRIKKIVENLKTFSRIDESDCKMGDINAGLESTLNIVWNELKYKATIEKQYGDIPHTKCNLAQLNQVFMNLMINAAQAIDEKGEIAIRTEERNGNIYVTIRDTGCGIPAEKINRIFEPFYTTKEIGQGTGLGLSIAYDIVKKGGGEITVESEVGKGTTFTVRIPVLGE